MSKNNSGCNFFMFIVAVVIAISMAISGDSGFLFYILMFIAVPIVIVGIGHMMSPSNNNNYDSKDDTIPKEESFPREVISSNLKSDKKADNTFENEKIEKIINKKIVFQEINNEKAKERKWLHHPKTWLLIKVILITLTITVPYFVFDSGAMSFLLTFLLIMALKTK